MLDGCPCGGEKCCFAFVCLFVLSLLFICKLHKFDFLQHVPLVAFAANAAKFDILKMNTFLVMIYLYLVRYKGS